MHLLLKNKNKIQDKGFSLIELMVAVSIFLIITSITLLNQNKFSSNILITNLAYQVALSVRQSQVYGIGSKLESDPTLKLGYGNHFIVNPLDGSNNRSGGFIFFADKGGTGSGYNGDYLYGGNSEWISDLNFNQGQYVSKICVRGVNGPNCSGSGGVTSLDIVFVKPNPEAYISINNEQNYFSDGHVTTKYDEADIAVSSPLGDKCRWIQVYSTGQIAVDQNNPLTTDPTECREMP